MTVLALLLVLACLVTGLQMVRAQTTYFRQYRDVHGESLILDEKYVAAPWLWFAQAIRSMKKANDATFRPQSDPELEGRRSTYVLWRRTFLTSVGMLLVLSVVAIVIPL